MTDLDVTFYDRHRFSADPDDPVDRWCQLSHSGNRASIQELLTALDLGGGDRVLMDPFCGAGSTLLAGARSGRRVAGCDVEPGAVAVSALKLAAPALAHDLASRGDNPLLVWAPRVAALVHQLPGQHGDTVGRILEDCRTTELDWETDGFGVTRSSAAAAGTALAPSIAGRTVDVFTSPPHDTGRASPWAAVDAGAAERVIADAPASVLSRPDRGDADHRTLESAPRENALDELGMLLSQLVAAGQLGRVAVEFEDAGGPAAAGSTLAERLVGLGLQSVTVVPLYAGSPDGTPGVTGGGVVTAHG